MQTLTQAMLIAWITRQSKAIAHCSTVIDANPAVPHETWRAIREARTEMIISRDELLALTVAPVEVEPAQ